MSAAAGRSRRRRAEAEEEPENHERWLVTYADMLTLLMVLFIVMFAMSQIDEKKYAELRSGLADGFGQDSSYSQGSDSILDSAGDSVTDSIAARQTFSDATDQKLVAAPVSGTDAADGADGADGAAGSTVDSQRYARAVAEVDRLEKVRRRLEAALRRQGLQRDVHTTIDQRGLVVSLVSRHVVFAADVADLSPRGARVVDVLAPVLRRLPDPLRIDGHTNQVDVHPRYYATDWDLSAARAVTVLRRLNEVDKVPQNRLSMSAFGHERPLVDPAEPGSQQVNKRVDIVVLPDLDEATRDLFPQVTGATGAPEAGGRSGAGRDEREAKR